MKRRGKRQLRWRGEGLRWSGMREETNLGI